MATLVSKQDVTVSRTDESLQRPVQESIATADNIEYFDIMIIGHTGQGKSTTTDKLLIANREEVDCTAAVNVTENTERGKLECGDITLWITNPTDFENEKTRLKSLVFARSKPNSHKEIQKIRANLYKDQPGTKGCELFSNEISKMRVLDVPGFFDEECIAGGPNQTVKDAQENTAAFNLGIMRKIIHIQTAMNMKFKRILYFLPVRGPLERASGVLQLELRVLTHFFGLSVIRKIVAVATNPPRMSKLPDQEAFPKEDCHLTMQNFRKSLKKLFPEEEFPPIPLIYLSLSDTCESVLQKVTEVMVGDEDLQLKLNPNTCAKCAKRVGVINGERMVCFIDGESKIPYKESTCHSKFIPDLHLRHKVADFFIKVFTLGLRSIKHLVVFDEICANCRGPPGTTTGCLRVGETFTYKKEVIEVDHQFEMPLAEDFEEANVTFTQASDNPANKQTTKN